MKKAIENAYAATLTGTFKVISPIKRNIINTSCEVHLFIQENALEILKNEGYTKEYELFKSFLPQINKGLVWADQDFKCYHHFYHPNKERGKFGYEENGMTVVTSYYNRAIKFFAMGNYQRAMFYFGAACHIIQDLTIPQHAKGRLLDNHRQFEVYVKSNYKNIKRFKATDAPVKFNTIEEYVKYNSTCALSTDHIYSNVDDNGTRFYLTAVKCITLAQRSSAGCMITFYKDLYNIRNQNRV